jgi:hypothetical protein
MNWLKQLFRKMTPLEASAKELVQAQHEKLQAQTKSEWYATEVLFQTRRIERLKEFVKGEAA